MSDRKPINKPPKYKLAKLYKALEDLKVELSRFKKVWTTKFNELNEKVHKFIPAMAQQFGQHQAHLQVNSQCIDKIDVQQQAIIKMLHNVYGRFEIMERVYQKLDMNMDDIDLEDVKKSGDATFNTLARACFDQVNEERKAQEEEQEKAEKLAKEEAAATEKAKEEAEVAEEALRSAENTGEVVDRQGGSGVEIPEGAEVFGG